MFFSLVYDAKIVVFKMPAIIKKTFQKTVFFTQNGVGRYGLKNV